MRAELLRQPKPQRKNRKKYDFAVKTAEEIASAILFGETTMQALYTFRNKSKNPNRQYPETLRAMAMVKQMRYNAETAQLVKNMISPYNEQLANGATVQEVIQPMVNEWKKFFFDLGVGLMDEQVLIAVNLLAYDKLKEMRGE